MMAANKGNQKQQKQQPQTEQGAEQEQPATTTSTVQVEPGYIESITSLWPFSGYQTLGIFLFIGLFVLINKLRARDQLEYKSQLAKKDEALKDKDEKLKILADGVTTLHAQLESKTKELNQTGSELIQAKSEIKTLKIERDRKSEKVNELSDKNYDLSQEIEDWKERVVYIEEQFQSHSNGLTSSYDMFKSDLEAARNDEIRHIRQKGELLVKSIREEHALKERERVKELTQAQIELEEMTKLIKEKNPTMYTAVQKELGGRVKVRLNGENRKETKKEQKQLVADERKMIEPAKS